MARRQRLRLANRATVCKPAALASSSNPKKESGAAINRGLAFLPKNILLACRLLQVRIQVHTAAGAHFQGSLPVLESSFLHGHDVIAFGNLDIRRCVADKAA